MAVTKPKIAAEIKVIKIFIRWSLICCHTEGVGVGVEVGVGTKVSVGVGVTVGVKVYVGKEVRVLVRMGVLMRIGVGVGWRTSIW